MPTADKRKGTPVALSPVKTKLLAEGQSHLSGKRSEGFRIRDDRTLTFLALREQGYFYFERCTQNFVSLKLSFFCSRRGRPVVAKDVLLE